MNKKVLFVSSVIILVKWDQPEDLKARRGKPPTWYKEYDVPQFERMISNPDGAVIREKESEYQKNLDNMTSEIPIITLDE